MSLNVGKEVAALQRLTVRDLRERYAEVFGEETRAGNKTWLVKRIAWRLQSQAEGDLSERARQRAAELANDADVRMSPPKAMPVAAASAARTKTATLADKGDDRLPLPGTILTREYKRQTLQVKVLPQGFEFEGEVYKSLSAVAKAITGQHCNGYYFFRLGKENVVCPEVSFGIYSAGLRRRDTEHPVIVASIQSVYRRACELDAFDLIMVDEAHLIPPEGDGMYQQFLADAKVINPNLRIIGFTATPFRMKTGPICTPDGILNHICFEVGVKELIRDGYLCPLITKAGINKVDTSRLHVRGGEFVAEEVEQLMDDESLVEAACSETVGYTQDRRAVLIFASGIHHGQHIVRVLADEHGIECGFVTGETPAKRRDEVLERFRSGDIKYLVNVNVLTTGFDAPNIDCVALVRPTMSPGLYYQMVGRGFRLHSGKQNCLVLDFGGNVLRHGPVDSLKIKTPGSGEGEAPVKECPECSALIAAGYARCPHCGHEFPPPERQKHDPRASDAGILSGQVSDTEYDVHDVSYSVHAKRNAPPDAPRTLRVDYRLGLNHYQSEFVCLEHEGYARQKAVSWWRRRSPDPVPDSAERAVEIAEGGGFARTKRITVRNVVGEKYDQIIGHVLGPLPEPILAGTSFAFDPAEVPF